MIVMGNQSYYDIQLEYNKLEADNARLLQDSRRHREGTSDQTNSLPLEYYPEGGGRRQGEVFSYSVGQKRPSSV